MKLIWKEILVCLLMGLVVPGAMMEVSGALLRRQEQPVAEMVETVPGTEETEVPQETRPPVLVSVRYSDTDIRQEELEEYLVGVVLAEMPASFESEALKAQAVAARTYAGKAERTGGKHGDGSICTRDQCCQAWISPEDYLQKGGMPQAVEKVRHAVEATENQVLIYDGELIEATYFSCSGGSTEDAKAVWGSDFPYLRAVDSPGEEQSGVYLEAQSFSKERLELLLGITLPDDPAQWLGERKDTPGKGVASLEIGGETFSGTQLRSLLGLRSTYFTATAGDHGLIVETRGYGHRVGMSQYGADAMAATGKTWQEILSYYYQGTALTDLRDLQEAEPADIN